MDTFLVILAYLFSVLGIAGCIIPILPGTAFSYLGLLFAYMTTGSDISGWSMVAWLVISLVVIAADYYLPALFTKRFGGSKAGTIGATVGIFAGMFLMTPFIGLIFGPFFGAVIGELLHDKSDPGKALVVGFGSFVSFIVGTGLKLIVAIVMLMQIISKL